MNTILVYSKEEALKKLLEIIPTGSNVMTGGSMTLQEIGFNSILNGSKYNYLKKEILQSHGNKTGQLRRHALTADYYIASINAIAVTGEIVCIDHGGSRISTMPTPKSRSYGHWCKQNCMDP